jgi:amino acid transporter
LSAVTRRARRGVKVRGGNLGAILCWAVVFADIGTSVYYTPGILYGHFGARSAIFVLMALFVFVLLCVKYAEVTWRYPEGGGVVNVSSQAIHPFAGLLGGLFILVDYYLTAAISALSGVIYLAVVVPGLAPWAVAATIAALVALGLLNLLGIQESARTTAVFAMVAGAGQLAVVGATAVYLGPAGVIHSFSAIGSGPPLTPVFLITGYGAAFLAFSGLESIAQLAPAMREPRRTVAYKAMGAVVLTMAVTSPLLTLWSTTLLQVGPATDPNQFISLLGAHEAGHFLGDYAAVTGAMLLIFASNTAIIGAYHVFIALARMGFLPRAVEHRNQRRGTPHWAIIASVALPLILIGVVGNNVNYLGDLYAFGLLGTFVLTCVSLDLVRWREYKRWTPGLVAFFGLGVVTTLLVLFAWSVNLVQKPEATRFGGGVTLAGLVVGLATYRYMRDHRPAVFPVSFRPQRAKESIATALGSLPSADHVLVILPHEQMAAEVVISEAARVASGRGIVFLYRGTRHPHRQNELLEVSDPYLKDFAAHDAFARAEMLARKRVPSRRYVYMPGSLPREMVAEVWRAVSPVETVVTDDDQAMLPPVAIDRIRRHVNNGVTVLHMYTSRVRTLPHAATA